MLMAATGARIGKDVNTTTSVQTNVIVQFTTPPSAASVASIGKAGGVLRNLPGVLNAAAATLPGNAIPAFANSSGVAAIALDHNLSTLAAPASAWIGARPDWGWKTVRSDLAGSVFGFDGRGIAVAVIDSGIDVADDLKDANGRSRVVYAESFVPGDSSTGDKFGHGDHVAGIIGGTGKDSTGARYSYTVRGVAPAVNFVNLRVLDSQGQGSDSAVIAAIGRAIQLRTVYNIRVINLSLGRPVADYCANDLLCQAVQTAWQNGIVVVAAAGNDGRDNSFGTGGYATINAPGNSPYAITVGAMNTRASLTATDDTIASYSSKGPTLLDHYAKPDLVAPGNNIYSLRDTGSWLDVNYPGNRVPLSMYAANSASPVVGPYFVLSGTSMATGAVSGAVALLLEQNPALTPDQVKARLMKTADKLPAITYTVSDAATGQSYAEQNDLFTIGAGYLDIPAALASRDVVATAALSPTAVTNFSGQTTLSFPSSSGAEAWGISPDWASPQVWGRNGIQSDGSLWGSSAVWAAGGFSATSSATSGSGAIWGTNVLWGSKSRTGSRDIIDGDSN